ncbi:MAG: acetylornithine transaminase [Nocardioidaceae bacterium]
MTTTLDRYSSSLMNTYGPPKRVLVRGEGCYVWDEQGRRYLDLVAGIAVNVLGHAHPAVIAAVTEQLSTLGHVSNLFASPAQVALADRLLAILGSGSGDRDGDGADGGRVFFTNSGTEANEAAFKMSRRTGRTTIVSAEGAFHGRTMGALALTAKSAYREPFRPLPGDVRFVRYGDAAALAAAVDDETAAIVLEPIQGEAGVIVPPADYLSNARDIADRHGTLLWLDEIQTGIGRTGRWFAHQHAGVRPDIVTLAKGLAGGIPIGACIGLGDAGRLLGPGQHGSTFGGNPVAAAAGLAVLDTIESEGLLEHAAVIGHQLRSALTGSHPAIERVNGVGLLLGIQLCGPLSGRAARLALDAGYIVNDVTPTRLRLAPPLILSQDQADTAVHAIPGILDQATRAEEEDS